MTLSYLCLTRFSAACYAAFSNRSNPARRQKSRPVSRSSRHGVGQGALFRRTVAPSCGQAAQIVLVRGLDIEAPVANHPGGNPAQRLFAQQQGQQVRLSVAGILELVAINSREEGGQLEVIQDALRKAVVFRRTHVERESLIAKLGQQLADAGIN